MIALALMLVQLSPRAQQGVDATAAHDACLVKTARMLERSGDPPADVAAATVRLCVPAEMRIQPGSPVSNLPADDLLRFLKSQREMYEEGVRSLVVQIRACRTNPACGITPGL